MRTQGHPNEQDTMDETALRFRLLARVGIAGIL